MTHASRTHNLRRAQRRHDLRRARYEARSVLHEESAISRVRRCGIGTNARSGGNVGIVVTDTPDGRRAGVAGVESCGSTWACPVCSEKIQAHRQGEVESALVESLRRGWAVGFVTLTVRHRRGHDLGDVWSAVSDAWRSTTSGSHQWRLDRELYDLAGYIRLTEVTHGNNGWHVHVHALILLRTGRDEDVVTVGRRMGERWRDSLKGTGFHPSKKHGADVQVVTRATGLSDYFTKQKYTLRNVRAAAHDVTSSHAKQAAHGNVTPFGLLARLVEHGDETDLLLWREWERVSKGRRQLLWSNGLRAELHVSAEKSDQDVVDEDHGGVPVLHVEGRTWRAIARSGLVPALLEAAEALDAESARRVILSAAQQRGCEALWWLHGSQVPPQAA